MASISLGKQVPNRYKTKVQSFPGKTDLTTIILGVIPEQNMADIILAVKEE